VRLTDELDWTELEQVVEEIRRSKLKNEAGRPPHLRALIGAVVLRSTHRMSYRETEDQIRHYAPARYLCALTETDWTPDANTIADFEQLMGQDGMKRLNEYVVKEAVDQGLADQRVLVADTTAQQAVIPYPNELNLMAAFLSSLATATSRAGGALKAFAGKVASKFREGKRRLREFRLFAKDKSKAVRMKLMSQMATLVQSVQSKLATALKEAERHKTRLVGYAKVAHAKAHRLHQTMTKLLPQIRYWIRTGFVAANKIVSVHIPELYSIVRGKVGKPVEFGLEWGIARLKGGFLLATVGANRKEITDSKFALKAVDDHKALFGKPPEAYAYDRGGWSEQNLRALKARGVKHVGLAPRGRAQWAVHGSMKEKLVRERAQVEGGIGAIKNGRYGFNQPAARSAAMMGVCGQRAVLGLNLNKLVRGLAGRKGMVLVG
jgi:IS5 family transposase